MVVLVVILLNEIGTFIRIVVIRAVVIQIRHGGTCGACGVKRWDIIVVPNFVFPIGIES